MKWIRSVTLFVAGIDKPAFVAEHRAAYDELRKLHAAPRQKLVTIEAARANRTPITWRAEDLPAPEFEGVRVLDDVSLATLREYIDWTPFFQHEKYGEQARQIFAEGNALLDVMVKEQRIRARGVYGFFRARGVGDDVELYGAAGEKLPRFHFLRQQAAKDGDPHRCLADFVAPAETALTAPSHD